MIVYNLRKLFLDPIRLFAWAWSKVGHVFSDALYLKIRFFLLMGKRLNLDKPQTFNEKLQWLKLYNRKSEYSVFVDKYAVKSYVAGTIGAKYVIPTLGVWDNPEEIDWVNLPNRFVLKTTHGGGSRGVVICKDKESFNKEAAITILKHNMTSSDWRIQMEWPYKNVPHRIIAEQYLDNNTDPGGLYDYKFFCFNGVVRLFKIDFDRFTDHHANYYDREGNLLPLGEEICPPDPKKEILMPETLQTMICLAERLAIGLPFVRVDFYESSYSVFFGEMTFFPNGGFGKFVPKEWDMVLGGWIQLPEL